MSVMDDNAQKTPLARSLNRFARTKAMDAIQTLGKGLPCSVQEVLGPGIVTVNFEVATDPTPLPRTTMPVSRPGCIKYPIQVGDVGVALSAGLRTGGLTGLGAGTPNIQDTVGNLSAMTFFWLGRKSEEFLDPDALDLYSNILCTPTQLAFFGGSKVDKQTITGPLSVIADSPVGVAAAKEVITSIIAALAAYNIIIDGTT
jgi:hypothetical protein